jgi:deoxycytidylate deaminase
MKDIVKYIMGVAAKSNVEKRKVGCVITNAAVPELETIVAEGYNVDNTHAEAAACEDLIAEAVERDGMTLKAYVTHQPCPECAKLLVEHGIVEVEIVEQFMKFDSDKLRYDLVDPKFALDYLFTANDYGMSYSCRSMKEYLYLYLLDTCLTPAIVQVIYSFDSANEAEETLVKVLTFGASKYKPGNWKHCTDTGRYLAAAHRHNNAIAKGEKLDSETNIDHRGHLLCNLMFLHVLGLKTGE